MTKNALKIAHGFALFAVLVLEVVSSDATTGVFDDGDACPHEATAGDETSMLQTRINAKALAPLMEDSPNVKHLPLSRVPILNYHLAYPSGPEPSLSELSEGGVWIANLNETATDVNVSHFCTIVASISSGTAKCLLEGHPTEHGIPFVAVRATEQELDLVAQRFNGVEFLEPDMDTFIIPEEDEPMDSSDNHVQSSTPWGLDRVDTKGKGGDGKYDPPASGGAGAHVYVADTGIRTSHTQFAGRAINTLDMTVGKPKECKGDTTCATDRHGHGTHCAGTVGGKDYGVAPKATIHAVKVLSDRGSGTFSAVLGSLDWILASGPKPAVWSASLGGSGTSQSVRNGIDKAVAGDVVVVVAAGNSNRNACNFQPAFVPSAITVGSSTSTDSRSSFSNYGTCVDIFAPGSQVLSASHRSDTASATFSGTSMACPHVAGAAALVLAEKKSAKATAVWAKLKGDANTDMIKGPGSGSPNLLLYVGDIGSGCEPTPAPTPAPTLSPTPAPTPAPVPSC